MGRDGLARLECGHRLRHAVGQYELLAELDVGASLGSARIVLHQEFIQCDPSSSDANHHGTSQDTHETQLLGISKPVLALANLEHAELLPTRTQHHQPLDLVVDLVRVRLRLAVLPVGPERRNELLPIDQAFAVTIKQIGHRVHLQLGCVELRSDDSVDEDLPWDQSVVVLVHLAEQIRQAALLVVHELEEALAPLLPAELPDALQVLKVEQVVVQAALTFPRQHPHVAPLVPQELGTRRAQLRLRLVAWRKPWTIVRQAIPFRCLGLTSRTHATCTT